MLVSRHGMARASSDSGSTSYKKRKSTSARNIQLEVDSGVIAYIERFEDHSKTGYRFSLDKFDGKKLVSHMTAKSIKYDTAQTHRWQIKDYMIRSMDDMHEKIEKGEELDTLLMIEPDDFLDMVDEFETLTSPELLAYIDRQKQRGFANIKAFEIEYHKRIATSFASFILTLIGVSLSSSFAINGNMPAIIAVWIPNILYAGIAWYLYKKAPQ